MLLLFVACDDGRAVPPGTPGGSTPRSDAGPVQGADASADLPDIGPTDPRCDPGCTPDVPTLEGFGEVCDAESEARCKAACSTRVAGLSAACAACLSDDVNLGARLGVAPGECIEPGEGCSGARCFVRGQEICSYCQEDSAARDDCFRRAFPRREVYCAPALDPHVSSCASVCTANDRTTNRPTGIDPRCSNLCRISQPAISGAGEVCSAASAQACLTQCTARIASAKSLCASCLLEGARFGRLESGVPGSCSTDRTCSSELRCEFIGRMGTCSYCAYDQTQLAACQRMVNPLQIVECPTSFGDAAGCGEFCE